MHKSDTAVKEIRGRDVQLAPDFDIEYGVVWGPVAAHHVRNDFTLWARDRAKAVRDQQLSHTTLHRYTTSRNGSFLHMQRTQPRLDGARHCTDFNRFQSHPLSNPNQPIFNFISSLAAHKAADSPIQPCSPRRAYHV